MKAVSNTTPLRYLIAIEQEHLLGQLFEKVFVPVAVHEELTDSRTPETVRGRVLSLPDWFEVRMMQETQTTTFPVTLHRGERQAILLAEALRADVLLIDEQIGRTIALSRNLPLSGTLGVLERADSAPTIEGERVLYHRGPGAPALGASSHAPNSKTLTCHGGGGCRLGILLQQGDEPGVIQVTSRDTPPSAPSPTIVVEAPASPVGKRYALKENQGPAILSDA